MYRNWTKKVGIKYILGLTGIFFAGFVTLVIMLFALKNKGYETAQLESAKILLLSFCLALIPTGSFSGFVVAFNRIDELNVRKMSLIVVFCIPIVLGMVVFGLIMIIPSIIMTVKLKNT